MLRSPGRHDAAAAKAIQGRYAYIGSQGQRSESNGRGAVSRQQLCVCVHTVTARAAQLYIDNDDPDYEG